MALGVLYNHKFPMTKERYNAPAPEAFAGESHRPRDIAAAVSDEYWNRVRLFAARQLHDQAEAEDVAQETMRIVLEALGRATLQHPQALPGFVFQTARHLCLKRMRAERRGSAALAKLGTEEIDPAIDPLSSLIAEEGMQRLREVMASLPENDGLLLRLFYVDGLSAEEVARRLFITAVAVRVRKHRLIARLASIIAERNIGAETGTQE
jgi:RNA polymerase sigma-70 factor (ECF subfamily)